MASSQSAAYRQDRVRSNTRLLVVGHVPHYEFDGKLWAYGPYAREIDIWADLFGEVVIAAPRRREAPPSDATAFSRTNITMRPQRETGGDTFAAKLVQVLWLPILVVTLARAMRDADAIHVRCPGNLGLLGSVMAPVFSRFLIAKYAGQWNGYVGEPWTVRLQRRILSSRWWKGPVTVYGNWPDQPPHVVSFFTSMMTQEQINRASATQAKSIGSPLRVLYSGVLTSRKRVSTLIDAVKTAADRGIRLELTIVGDGIDRRTLESQVVKLGLSETVRFIGALPFEEVQEWYAWAHCLVLPSKHSEGWPKAVAEAMSHGLVCIAVNHGQMREMLDGRGVLLVQGTEEEIAAALESVARSPERFDHMRQEAVRWASHYSLEGLRAALDRLLVESWRSPGQSLRPKQSDIPAGRAAISAADRRTE